MTLKVFAVASCSWGQVIFGSRFCLQYDHEADETFACLLSRVDLYCSGRKKKFILLFVSCSLTTLENPIYQRALLDDHLNYQVLAEF